MQLRYIFFIISWLVMIMNNAIIMAQSDNKPTNIRVEETIYQKDFEDYWETVEEHFAYFDRQKTDWDQVKTIYQPIADTITNKRSFIRLLEQCNNELYNGHINLNTNLTSSSRLIPSSTDLWAKKVGEKVFIQAVREGCNAEAVGLKIGMEITHFNDEPILSAIQKYLPKSFTDYDDPVYDYAVNLLLAGTHDTPRKITIKLLKGKTVDFYPDKTPNDCFKDKAQLLEAKILEENIAYIKINNSLGEDNLIAAFDHALDSLFNTDMLILDLRETPSGGNNTVAKGIMGRLIDEEMPYQRYRYVLDEKDTDVPQIWTELVLPREKHYSKPVVLWVNYWTGSMGEGMTIGLDAMNRVEVIGTPLADLLGAVWSFNLKETGIGFQIPGVKLYHINKTPREDFVPAIKAKEVGDYLERTLDMMKK